MIDTFTNLWNALPDSEKSKLLFSAIFGSLIFAVSGAILRDLVLSLGKLIINLIIKVFLYFFLGSKLFNYISIRNYAQNLLEKYKYIKVPFMQNKIEISKVFVPLSLSLSDGNIKTDNYLGFNFLDSITAITNNQKTFILGFPGSGKTTLIKCMVRYFCEQHLSLNYKFFSLLLLKNNSFINQDSPNLIPIYIELRNYNPNKYDLFDYCASILTHNKFMKSKKFLKRSFENSSVIIFLDGLDEITLSNKKTAVVKEIQELMSKFPLIRICITCRTAVYHNELFSEIDKIFYILDFQDSQIRKFMSTWKMPEGKSVDQLMIALRDKPRIKELARNPLLLTIIAYLYCFTTHILPKSRAEFYEMSTDLLLRTWKEELALNKYRPQEKRRILQHLAMYNQTNQELDSSFELSYNEINRIISKFIESHLDLSKTDTKQIIGEIVDRSGLLLRLDGGETFQFAHLTIQEFFAASYLKEDENKLLEYFKKNPDRWREVILLVCGLLTDSTNLIRALEKLDLSVAIEGLTNVIAINDQDADRIIGKLKKSFHSANIETDQRLIVSFGILATDLRPRGKNIFKFLRNEILQGSIISKNNAALALSVSNNPEAAEIIVNQCNSQNDFIIFKKYILKMGDLSINPLISRIMNSDEIQMFYFQIIVDIATPQAAERLIKLLWSDLERVRFGAAWALSILLSKIEIIDHIRFFSTDLSSIKHDKDYNWVWKPFIKDRASYLPLIAGQIVKELNYNISNWQLLTHKTRYNMNNRIAICGILDRWTKNENTNIDEQEKSLNDFTQYIGNKLRSTLLSELMLKKVSKSHWINIYEQEKYDFENSKAIVFSSFLFVLSFSLVLFNIVLEIVNPYQTKTAEKKFLFLIINIYPLYALIFYFFESYKTHGFYSLFKNLYYYFYPLPCGLISLILSSFIKLLKIPFETIFLIDLAEIDNLSIVLINSVFILNMFYLYFVKSFFLLYLILFLVILGSIIVLIGKYKERKLENPLKVIKEFLI